MSDNNEDEDSLVNRKKLYQFWDVVKRNKHPEQLYWAIDKVKMRKELEKIIEQPGDINRQFNNNDFVTLRNPQLRGCSALHLAVGQKNQITVEFLLSKKEIDFTIQNYKRATALHDVVANYYDYYENHWSLKGKLENGIVDVILSAHIRYDVSLNPYDNRGISHFHIACMANNVKTVEFFINKGLSVNEVNVGDFSSSFLHYTPLHIAVECSAYETVELLLKNGADVLLKNAKGMTALHLLLAKNMTSIDLINSVNDTTTSWIYKIPKLILDVETNKKIMELLILHIVNSNNQRDFDNEDLSLFHVACTLKNTTLIKQLMQDVNQKIKVNSSFWPGYTACHFAAHFDVDILKFLLDHGADIIAKDANGLTPFDICIERYELQDIHCILSSDTRCKNILLSDDKTTLLDVIAAMKNSQTLADFLKDIKSCDSLRISKNSPIWSGYTLLHLAVTFVETMKIISNYQGRKEYTRLDFEDLERDYLKRIKLCLEHGVDVTTQDNQGSTALHLAYRMQKEKVVVLLIQEHTTIVNPVDDDNLSHLYIACAFHYPRLVDKLLKHNESHVNMRLKEKFNWRKHQKYFVRKNREKESYFYATVGSTSLHVAVTTEATALIRNLLDYGADVNARDENGVTPLHRVLACKNRLTIGRILLSCPDLQEYTFKGLNFLHLAAEYRCDEKVIDKLIRLGADVNSIIDYDTTMKTSIMEPFAYMKSLNKFRPIDIAIRRNYSDVVKILLKRGVDILAIRPDGWTILHGSMLGWYCDNSIIPMFKRDVEIQKCMNEGWGITLLHLACGEYNIDNVRYFLKKGLDVNQQVKLDSPLWPGCTPMHVLALQLGKEGSRDKIYDVMKVLLENGADPTIQNVEKNSVIHLTEIGFESIPYDFYAKMLYTELLLKSLTDFNVNPINNDGISHFHVACLRSNVVTMENFLKCNVDVNQTIYLHSSKFPGCTSLHLVLEQNAMIDNEVQVQAIDLLYKYGVDVNATDLYGNNAFHAAVKCPAPRDLLFKKIFRIGTTISMKNVFGEEPLGMMLISKEFEYEDVRFFLKRKCHPNLFEPIRDEGCLKIFFFKNIAMLRTIIKTAGITTIDEFNRNAIHNVVSWKFASTKDYVDIIRSLMRRGCDIDLQDKLGKTPLHYTVNFRNHEAVNALLKAGADINITDVNGNSPFSYVFSFSKTSPWHQFEFDYKLIYRAMVIHVSKLQMSGVYLSELNVDIMREILKKWKLDETKIMLAKEELIKMKDLKIKASTLSPYDFLLDTEALASFSNMSIDEKVAVNKFFHTIKNLDFPQFGYLLRIRYENLLKKFSSLKVN